MGFKVILQASPLAEAVAMLMYSRNCFMVGYIEDGLQGDVCGLLKMGSVFPGTHTVYNQCQAGGRPRWE